jgi:hypothetical protein
LGELSLHDLLSLLVEFGAWLDIQVHLPLLFGFLKLFTDLLKSDVGTSCCLLLLGLQSLFGMGVFIVLLFQVGDVDDE